MAKLSAKRTFVLMSDNSILWKALWRNNGKNVASTGWHRQGKLKKGVEAQAWIESMERRGFIRILKGN